MNTIRDLKQQEKYTNMLKRKNKEKNIYKSKNSTLRIEKMNLIKAVERKDKEIERLNNRVKKLEKSIMISNKKHSFMTKDNIKLRTIINELENILIKQIEEDKDTQNNKILFMRQEDKHILNTIKELKGSDKE